MSDKNNPSTNTGYSAFAAPKNLDFSYSNIDFKPVYDNSYTDYSKPLSVENTNKLDLFNGVLNNHDNKDPVPWYKDNKTMQSYAGLASAFVGLATLPAQLAAYRQNLKESRFNLERAKVAANRSDTMYSNLANHRMGSSPAGTQQTPPTAPPRI